MARRPSSVRLSVCLSVCKLLRKSLLLAGKCTDRHQTCTRWTPGQRTSRVCSRSRSKVTWYAHFFGFLEWATPSLTVWYIVSHAMYCIGQTKSIPRHTESIGVADVDTCPLPRRNIGKILLWQKYVKFGHSVNYFIHVYSDKNVCLLQVDGRSSNAYEMNDSTHTHQARMQRGYGGWKTQKSHKNFWVYLFAETLSICSFKMLLYHIIISQWQYGR